MSSDWMSSIARYGWRERGRSLPSTSNKSRRPGSGLCSSCCMRIHKLFISSILRPGVNSTLSEQRNQNEHNSSKVSKVNTQKSWVSKPTKQQKATPAPNRVIQKLVCMLEKSHPQANGQPDVWRRDIPSNLGRNICHEITSSLQPIEPS